MDKQILAFVRRFNGGDAYIVGEALEKLSAYADTYDDKYIKMARDYLSEMIRNKAEDYTAVDDGEEHCTLAGYREKVFGHVVDAEAEDGEPDCVMPDCNTCIYCNVPSEHEPCVRCMNSYGSENLWTNHYGCENCKHWEDETYCVDCKGTKLHGTAAYKESLDLWEAEDESDSD